jgi:hypothetical protein
MTNIMTMNNSDYSSNDNRKKLKLVLNFCYYIPILINTNFRIKRVNIELGELTQHNLKQLKLLNRDIFPVSYNEKFYKDLLAAGELCKLGNANDELQFSF